MADRDRVRDIFRAAVEFSPEQRSIFLTDACGGDVELRAELDRLLATNAGLESILDPKTAAPADATTAFGASHPATVVHSGTTPATDASDAGARSPTERSTEDGDPYGATGTFAPPDPDASTAHGSASPRALAARGPTSEGIGTVIAGRYTLVEVIGEGGMGSVYLASQTQPVKRQVALKLIKTGMDSRGVLARFDAERQALALMDHPNIARIYDGGVTPAGQPFFVMELVTGVPLTEFCDQKRLTVAARLELFVAVCQAVQHAHQKGIIHRDLKPGNVLVTEVDGRATPKVIDFGVAKATEVKLTDMSLADIGAIVGTPAYMSPEQADPSSMDIDTRTDVYALGVMLYELLTGAPPINAKEFQRGAILEMLRMVREVDPPRPSTKLSTAAGLQNIAANRSIDPARLAKLMQGELDWVVMKALEKDRSRRYDTAIGFARDIQRYLADEIVEARPPSAGYRLKKFLKRNKVQAIAASLVLIALLGGVIGTTYGMVRADRARIAADRARDGEKTQRVKAEGLAIANAKLAQQETKAKNEVAAKADELKHRLGVSNMLLASAAFDNHDVKLAAERLDSVPPEQRGWEWYYAKQQIHGGLFTLYGHTRTITCVAFSPDSTRIVTGAWEPANSGAWDPNKPGEVKVWDARTGTLLFELREHPNAPGIKSIIKSVAFSPDGSRILTGGENNTAKVWDARTGAVLLELKGHTTPVLGVAFSPDGTRIITGGDARYGIPRGDVLRIAPVQGPGEVKVWDARTGQVQFDLKGHTTSVTSLAFSPDGTRIVTIGGVSTMPTATELKVWDAAKGGKALFEFNGINITWCNVSYSPDGKWIVTGDGDGATTILNASTGTVQSQIEFPGKRDQVTMFDPHLGKGVLGASFSPDGTRIATALGLGNDRGGEAIVWDARTRKELVSLKGHIGQVTAAVFSPDGTRIVTGSADRTVKVWDARLGTAGLELAVQGGGPASVAFSSDGKRIATGSADASVRVWDVGMEAAPLELKGNKGEVRAVSFSRDGTRILTAGGGGPLPGQATVWDAKTGKVLRELIGLMEGVLSAAFSPDGTRIVTGGFQVGGRGGTELKLWDARTGAVLFDLTEPRPCYFRPSARGWSVAFSPDGKRFVSGGGSNRRSVGNELIVWDTQTGKAVLELDTEDVVQSVAFNQDGKQIVTGGIYSAKVWDAEKKGTPALELKGHLGFVLSAAFSPDSDAPGRIVTGGSDGTAKLWDLRTGMALTEIRGHSGAVQSVAFSPDGTRILSGGGAFRKPAEAFLWSPRTGMVTRELKGRADAIVGLAFSADGTRLVTAEQKAGTVWETVWDIPSGAPQFELKGPTSGVSRVAFSLDGARIVTVNLDKSSTVWDARTGQEVHGEPIPQTLPENRISPDDRWFAHAEGNRVRFIAMKPDPEEIAYRRAQMQPNFERYREGYLAARVAGNEFEAKFYLKLLPAAERTALEAKSELDALVPLQKLAMTHWQAGKRDQALPLLVKILDIKKATLGPDDPDTLNAMNQLGRLYGQMGQFDKSIPLFEAILKNRETKRGQEHIETLNAKANLGVNYREAGRLEEAIRLLEEVLQAAKKFPQLQRVTGQLVDAYTRAGEKAKLASFLQEQLSEVRNALPKGSRQLAQRLAEFAQMLYNHSLHAASVRVWSEALATNPTVAADRQAQNRYNAACAAALAGCGKGKDDPPPSDDEKTRLRQQALDWLKAELDDWTKLAESAKNDQRGAIAPTLQHWKEDPDLAGVRDDAELAKLPESERAEFVKVWNHVDKLLRDALPKDSPQK